MSVLRHLILNSTFGIGLVFLLLFGMFGFGTLLMIGVRAKSQPSESPFLTCREACAGADWAYIIHEAPDGTTASTCACGASEVPVPRAENLDAAEDGDLDGASP